MLIKGLVAGQEASYNTLFNKYYFLLTVFAKNYLDDIDLARDLVQDVFVKIFESRHLLSEVDSLKAYLYKSVRNRCLNHIKLNQIHNKHKENIRLEQSGHNQDLFAEIEKSELEARIFHVISELPERCREVFRLSRTEGLRNEEIARKLNISKRTVETQISKALKKLRLELAAYLGLFLLIVLYVYLLSYLSKF